MQFPGYQESQTTEIVTHAGKRKLNQICKKKQGMMGLWEHGRHCLSNTTPTSPNVSCFAGLWTMYSKPNFSREARNL